MPGMSVRALGCLLLASTLALACTKDGKPEGAVKAEGAARADNGASTTGAPPAATASAAPAATGAGVTFTRKAPTVGTKREESGDMSMSMRIDVDPGNGKPQKTEMSMAESTKQSQELLAVSGDAPTKVKVTFTSIDAKMVEGGKENRRPTPLAGKTYVVEAKDGKIDVKDDKGKAVAAAETKEVSKHFKSLGKPDPVAAALPTTPLRPGEKVEALSRSLESYMQQDESGLKVSDVTVTFREKLGDDGVFDLTLKMGKEEGPMSMTMDLKGEMRISTTTGEPRKMELKGPITIGSTGGTGGKGDPKSKMKMDGSGSMAMSMAVKSL
jgi:hypothetical protein